MKTTIKINKLETKTSRQGKAYATLDTSEGIMSCFDSKIIDVLRLNLGKFCICDITEVNGYKNIMSAAIGSEPLNQTSGYAEYKKPIPNSMIISYVKDLVCSGIVKYEKFEEACRMLIELNNKL